MRSTCTWFVAYFNLSHRGVFWWHSTAPGYYDTGVPYITFTMLNIYLVCLALVLFGLIL